MQLDKLDRYTCLKDSGITIGAEDDEESSDDDEDDGDDDDEEEDDYDDEGVAKKVETPSQELDVELEEESMPVEEDEAKLELSQAEKVNFLGMQSMLRLTTCFRMRFGHKHLHL